MKRIILVLLSLLLILSLSFASYAITSDEALSGDKVVITDENWAYEKVHVYGWELDEYLGSSSEVVLPWSFAKEYVTSIGDHAFNANTTVTSVVTTGVIESMGDYAFNGCSSLESIVLYSALTSLGVGCFYGTSALSEINLEDTSITAIPAYCFAQSSVTELALPATCTSIGNLAFYQCADLKTITIPESVTEISENAFMDCPDLVIYCYTDSYAHGYAESKGIVYILLDAPVELEFLLGDADEDGSVSILDATTIQKNLASLIPDTTGMIKIAGNVDDDEELSIIDATSIQKWLATLPVDYPIGSRVTRLVQLNPTA